MWWDEGYTWIHASTHEQATMQCTNMTWHDMTWSKKYMAFILQLYMQWSRIWPNAMPCHDWIELTLIEPNRLSCVIFVSFYFHLHGSWFIHCSCSGILSYPTSAIAISSNHSNHPVNSFHSLQSIHFIVGHLGGLDLFYRWNYMKHVCLLFALLSSSQTLSLSSPSLSHLSPPPLP